MAKTVGSDADPRMPASPGAGGSGTNAVVTEGSFLQAVKEVGAATLKVKLANEERKTVRKRWKASGIALGPLDAMVKMAEWDRGEIRDHFSVEKQYATWLGLPVEGRQAEMFKGLADDEIQAKEWFATGRTASRTGKPPRAPEECPPEFHQAFMRGYNEEDEAAWSDSEKQDQQEAPTDIWAGYPDQPDDWSDAQRTEFERWFASLTQAQRMETQIGHVGVRKEFQRLMVAQTPKPGDADHVDPTKSADHGQPDWAKFSDDPDEWFAEQKRTFAQWFEGLPASAVVRISHPGVLKAFRTARDGEIAEGGDRATEAPTLDEDSPLPGEAAPAKGKGKGKPAPAAVH
jgi:hypothetical protein